MRVSRVPPAAMADGRYRPDPLKPSSLLFTVACSMGPLVKILLRQPMVIFGILGLPSSWWDLITLDLGLLAMLFAGRYIAAIGTIIAFIRPTFPGGSPSWLKQLFPVLGWLCYSDDATVEVVSPPPDLYEPPSSPETFVYVNGICTTKRMALATGQELATMFKTDVTVVHNPTDSALVDLMECIFSKMWIGQNWATTVPAHLLTVELMSALQDESKTKVVLVAHSQGTIIASDVLWRLWEAVDNGHLQESAMQKFEIYNFANAGHWMFQENGAPYIENIGNNYDNVGMLGAHAPETVKDEWNIYTAGEMILPDKPRWGHMISSHYLKHLKNGDYGKSKLHKYMARETVSQGIIGGT